MDGNTTSIIVALIGAFASIVTIIITSRSTFSKIQQELKTSDEVQNVRMDRFQKDLDELKTDQKEMREEIREHNKYAILFNELKPRMEKLEQEVNSK